MQRMQSVATVQDSGSHFFLQALTISAGLQPSEGDKT